MTIKLATWNLCLGLFHKKDYVRNLLYENNIDVLCLQETELRPNIDLNNLNIKGYTLEVEKNREKKRVATYIKNNLSYIRRSDLESPDLHLIILDLKTKNKVRLITIYRTFNPQDDSTAREFFRKQLRAINEATVETTILMGDFNLDENKRFEVNYGQRNMFQDLDEIIGHHHYTQHVNEPTWQREIRTEIKSSVIDHVYCTDSTKVINIHLTDTIFGDHKLVILTYEGSTEEQQRILRRRNWRQYTEELLIEELSTIIWQTEIDSVQEMWNSYENEIIKIVDKLAPIENTSNFIDRTTSSPALKRNLNRRNYLLKKRLRRTLNDGEKTEIKNLNKQIRYSYYKDRRQHVRTRIKPGNTKSLWDAVKIAKDIEPIPLPNYISREGTTYMEKDISSVFPGYFGDKIATIQTTTKKSVGVYKGKKCLNSVEKNFMTEEKVVECLKELKVKNCEGFDRIPLRVLRTGATILSKPLSVLFHKIYETKEIPEQWKLSKIIPLHKKGDRHEVSNYRPISNLCSVSKIYEKLILKRLEEIGEENNIDLTGNEQHGFKKKRSTITASLTLQSLISRKMDGNNFVAMASLDLSAAFDLVDLDELVDRLRVMGLPKDILTLLEIWLRGRFYYVFANGINSVVKESNVGTVQGSILGPILYALFIRPLYDLEKITTFADDNYIVSWDLSKHKSLEVLSTKLVKIMKWLKDSGLKVNENKTEMCIFHRNKNTEGELKIEEALISAKGHMNVLGMTFDSKLNWGPQVSRAIKGANKALQAVKMIKKFFNSNEITQLLTSNFYSRLYYGSEVWHLPTLNQNLKKLLQSASANALKLCCSYYDGSVSYLELHKQFKRALPTEICTYKHSLLLYKVIREEQPKREWMDLNFQMINTRRQLYFEIQNTRNYVVGNNILINRFSCLNKKILLQDLDLSLESFKVKCKTMFLNQS